MRETNARPLTNTSAISAGWAENWPRQVEFCIKHIRDVCFFYEYPRKLVSHTEIMNNIKILLGCKHQRDVLEYVDSHEISISVYQASINSRQWGIHSIACNNWTNKSDLVPIKSLSVLNSCAKYKSANYTLLSTCHTGYKMLFNIPCCYKTSEWIRSNGT